MLQARNRVNTSLQRSRNILQISAIGRDIPQIEILDVVSTITSYNLVA